MSIAQKTARDKVIVSGQISRETFRKLEDARGSISRSMFVADALRQVLEGETYLTSGRPVIPSLPK